jgi:hypothetical protein
MAQAAILRAASAGESETDEHLRWVAEDLKRMKTIRAGMTREQLLSVFTKEGGLSTRWRRTYVSKHCMYFKVDVEFRAGGSAEKQSNVGEGPDDVIVKISRPYLDYAAVD